jgi:hypothetical protein
MFGKTGNFPFSWNDLWSIFFQVLSTFPSVMVFPSATRPAIISPQNRDIFFMFQGRSTSTKRIGSLPKSSSRRWLYLRFTLKAPGLIHWMIRETLESLDKETLIWFWC